MLFKGALLSDLSGSLGGVVAARNNGGAYLRARSGVTNPNTTDQQRARADHAANSADWATLTEEQREDWNDYGQTGSWKNRIGESIVLSGIACFNKVNGILRFAGLTPITSPPTVQTALALLYGTVSVDAAGEIIVNVAAGSDVGASVRLTVSATAPLSAGINFPKGGFRRVATNTIATTGDSTFTYNRAGPAEGQVVFLRFRSENTAGQASEVITLRCVVIAAP